MPEGIALRTTKTEIETDDQGNQVKIDSYIKTDSGWDVLTTIEHTYDEHNNLIQTEKDGRVVYEAEYENLMIKSATGEAGETYTYTYDSLGQLTTVTKLGLTSEEAAPYPAQEHIYSVSEYDAAGRRVSSEITAGSLSLKSFYEYDSAGRLEEIREPGGFITSITYENGGRITRTTHPDGKEVVSTKRVD
ncbi:MAG: RHS repeat protein, partial [Opitutales bacterium]|nr:RHS repeat protein [Opitutales bacterium]